MKRITAFEWIILTLFLLACLLAVIAAMGAPVLVKVLAVGSVALMWACLDSMGVWRSIGSKLKDQ